MAGPAARNRVRHPAAKANSAERHAAPPRATSELRPVPAAFQFSNRFPDTPAITAFTLPVWRWSLREPVVFSRCLATRRKPKRPRFPAGFVKPLVLDYSEYSKQMPMLSKHFIAIPVVALPSLPPARRYAHIAALPPLIAAQAPSWLFRSRLLFRFASLPRVGSCTESTSVSSA
jgi:hypothetical protein